MYDKSYICTYGFIFNYELKAETTTSCRNKYRSPLGGGEDNKRNKIHYTKFNVYELSHTTATSMPIMVLF